MFSVAKTVHDSINAMTLGEEVRQASYLISSFIYKVDFGKQVEKHLNFLIEARRAFSNLDEVKEDLVRSACSTTMKTLALAKGKHNEETSAFVRSCISFASMTIPSIESHFKKLYLLCLTIQVALMNHAVTQAEALVKSTISLLQETPPTIDQDGKLVSTEQEAVSFVKYFLSLLLAVPGHPEYGPYYLFDALFKVLAQLNWDTKSSSKISIYITLLEYITYASQESLPYNYSKIENNYDMFDKKTLDKLAIDIIEPIFDEIFREIIKLDHFVDKATQHEVSEKLIDLLKSTIEHTEPNQKTTTFITKMFTKCKKIDTVQAKLRTFIESLSKEPKYQQLTTILTV